MTILVRCVLIGMAVLGTAGAVVGLILGLRTYPPTAWAAVVEVGLPAMLLGALYFQYFKGLLPCELCMWQRYAHRVVMVLGCLAALAAPRRGLSLLMLSLTCAALAGSAGIALFHAGVELHWWRGLPSCSTPACSGIRDAAELMRCLTLAPQCDKIPWSFLGLSMAAWNGIASALACLAGILLTLRVRRQWMRLTRPSGAV